MRGPGASRRRAAEVVKPHALFELRDNGWWVHDNASTNGTVEFHKL
jgi:pSer/pThr/pTyr-binding forkhead associated (FHA) protein